MSQQPPTYTSTATTTTAMDTINIITKEEIKSMKFMLPPRKLLMQKIMSWIEEDIPSFDVSAAIVGDSIKTSTIFYKKSNDDDFDTLPIIMCGIPILTVLFEDCFPHLKVNWLVEEGDNLNDGLTVTNLLKMYGSFKYPTQSQCEKKLKVPIAIVEGPVYQLLQVERLCLNILSHLTGISSISRKVHNLVISEIGKNGAKFRGEIAATRKTTPGLRHFEKYAVMVGGCKPHRMDLSQMVMLKDNHIDACNGSISKCVKKAKALCGVNTQKIEVECRSLQDAREAAQSGADIVMLDNFNAIQARDASDLLVKEFPNLVIEVSGGLNPETVLNYLKECSNVHVLSMGILTEGGGIKVDFSMKITETQQ